MLRFHFIILFYALIYIPLSHAEESKDPCPNFAMSVAKCEISKCVIPHLFQPAGATMSFIIKEIEGDKCKYSLIDTAFDITTECKLSKSTLNLLASSMSDLLKGNIQASSDDPLSKALTEECQFIMKDNKGGM